MTKSILMPFQVSRFRFQVILLTLTFTIMLLSVGCTKKPLFKGINGDKIKISSYKGKIVIINVFTTWCDYCKRLHPKLEELQRTRDDIVLIGAAVDTPEAVKKFVKENNIDYPVFITTKEEMLEKFAKVNMFPSTFILDKNGELFIPVYGDLPLEIFEQQIDQIAAIN